MTSITIFLLFKNYVCTEFVVVCLGMLQQASGKMLMTYVRNMITPSKRLHTQQEDVKEITKTPERCDDA